MPEQNGLNPAERELEEALRSLAPAAARIDAVSAAFEAGRRSVRRQVYLWRAATAAALLVGIGTSLVPLGSDFGAQPPIIVVTTAPDAHPPSAQTAMMLQAAFGDEGLAGLPAIELPRVDPTRSADWL